MDIRIWDFVVSSPYEISTPQHSTSGLAPSLCKSSSNRHRQQLHISIEFEEVQFIHPIFLRQQHAKQIDAWNASWNTSRWDAEAWRDTLSVFAENNGLILVCPDGGSDGRVDDNLDYDFTEDLLDSVRTWYSIDEDYQYIMGFSIGGKATYEFCFSHSTEFGGYIPIGAATSEAELSPGISSSLDEAYYLVHGSSDAASTRYNPILNRLQTEGAITNSEFMSGVGHTIDFPNRNQILTEAYVWIDSVNSAQLNSVPIEIQEDKLESTIELLQLNDVLTIKSAFDYQVNTYAIDGKVAELVELGENRYQLPSRTGVYLVSF